MDNKITYIDLKNINPHVRISRINFLNSEFSTGYRMIYHHQMLYIYGGCGEIEVEGVCYKASKGDLFYWGPAQKHKIMSDAKKPLVILGVQFDFTRNHEDKSYLLEFTSAEHFDYGEIHEMIRFHDFEGFKPYTKVYNCSEAEKQLLEIANECKTQKRFYSERMSAIFKAFLIMIVRQTLAEPLREEEHQNLVDKVIQYIHEHYEKPLTNQEIAHIYNFHPNYINKLMVIYTGLSLHQYILNVRMNKALELLNETNKTISEICCEVGFQNIYHFSNLFKKKVGYAPSALRLYKHHDYTSKGNLK